MNTRRSVLNTIRSRGGLFVALALVCTPPALAVDPVDASDASAIPTPLAMPITTRGDNAGLAFDVGDSDVRKLRLQLSQPLGIEATEGATWLNGQGGLVLGSTGLDFALGDDLSIASNLQVGASEGNFRPVGHIHCENGTLDAISYRASNCYFIDDRASATRAGLLSLGARYQPADNLSVRANLFQAESSFSSDNRPGSYGSGMAALDPTLLSIMPAAPRFMENAVSPALESLDSSVSGVNLEFQVGVSTDRAGDMVLGLQLTRVLDADFQGTLGATPGLSNWTIAAPFDSARLSFDWHKGAFSGGIQSYYRDQVDFLGRSDLDNEATFDVHFTWRAPWNASVSVGASNVLNAGVDDDSGAKTPLVDPFESVYGRIPYVRYKQDL